MGQYAVVGCSHCGTLWILDGGTETATCPGCGTRHTRSKLRSLVETDDVDRARTMRARLLADRTGATGSGTDLDSFVVDSDRTDTPVVDDDEYLGAAGLDAAAIAAATTSKSRKRSKQEIVFLAIEAVDDPTRDNIIDYTAKYGVPQDYTDRMLDRLIEAGSVTVSDGRFRVL